MYICSLCDKEFKDRRSLSYHVTRTERSKFNNDVEAEKFIVDTVFGESVVRSLVNQYVSEEICCYDLSKNNQDIVKYLKLLGVKRTSSEERKTNRYKSAYLAGIQASYGSDIVSVSQVAEVQAKKEKTAALRHGSYQKFLSDNRERMALAYELYAGDAERLGQTYAKIEQTVLERYGVSNISKIDVVRDKNSMSSLLYWSGVSYDDRLKMTAHARKAVCSRGGYESSIERRVQECLADMGLVFTKHVMLFGYNYDILLSGNIILEIQGDFWHGNPLKYKADDTILGKLTVSDVWEKDAKKKVAAECSGLTVVYIWEADIRSCVTKSQLVSLISSKLGEIPK